VTDEQVVSLVARARAGDQVAWGQLVERFAPLLWSVCRRYRLSDADCRDVAQTVWLRLLEHLATLREPAALPGWLATTVARECIAVHRSTDRQAFGEMTDEDLTARSEVPTPEDVVIVAERNDAVRAAIAELSDDCRRLFTLTSTNTAGSASGRSRVPRCGCSSTSKVAVSRPTGCRSKGRSQTFRTPAAPTGPLRLTPKRSQPTRWRACLKPPRRRCRRLCPSTRPDPRSSVCARCRQAGMPHPGRRVTAGRQHRCPGVNHLVAGRDPDTHRRAHRRVRTVDLNAGLAQPLSNTISRSKPHLSHLKQSASIADGGKC
jgi:RNA polymerase sigma factor (sigma-70 family)